MDTPTKNVVQITYHNTWTGEHVEICSPYGDLDIFEMGEEIRKMLLAVGYTEKMINNILKEQNDENKFFTE